MTIQRTPKWSDVPLYYRADYKTYLKIRAIRKMFYRTLVDYAAWRRWDRKMFKTTDEPVVCRLFVNTNEPAQEIVDGLERWFIWLEDIYELARMPSATEVAELSVNTVDQIHNYFTGILAYLPGHQNPYYTKNIKS